MNCVKVFGLLSVSIPLVFMVSRYYWLAPKPKTIKEKKKAEVICGGTSDINNSCLWSELDSDVLGQVVSRLCLTDQVRLRVVCKNWLAAVNLFINAAAANMMKSPPLPWSGCLLACTLKFLIYDPLSSSPAQLASLQNIWCSKLLGIPPSPPFSNIRMVTLFLAKHNWLFISIKKPKLFFWTRRYLLLFSPFTKTIITLPQFDCAAGFRFTSTFSTHPHSPHCIFFMVDGRTAHKKIAVVTYRNGDKQWTAREFNTPHEFLNCFCLSFYLGGILYIVSPFGQVASYNILNAEIRFDCLLLDELLVQNAYKRTVRLFVLDGELIILNLDPLPNKNVVTLPGKQCIRRFDWSRKVWVPLSTLGDKTVFVSQKIMSVSLINTRDYERNNAGVLSDKIYHFFDGGCVIYSIKDGDLVEYKSINSDLLEHGGGDLPEYKCDRAIMDTVRAAYWLEAPTVGSSSDNQQVQTRGSKAQFMPLDDQPQVPIQISHRFLSAICSLGK